MHRLRQWHRWIGIVAALEFLILLVTGLILNHNQALKLDSYRVASPWLMRWYGLRSQTPADGFLFMTSYLTWNDEKWVMDGRVIAKNMLQPVGAVEVNGIRYVATAAGLYLYLPQGQLVDKIEKKELPAIPIRNIGTAYGKIVLKTPVGSYASLDGLTWRKMEAAEVNWAARKPLPPDILKEQSQLFAPTLSLERILTDLHSGLIFGRFGPLVADLSAAALLALLLSGVWMYRRSNASGGGSN
jgi:hypothetical protein